METIDYHKIECPKKMRSFFCVVFFFWFFFFDKQVSSFDSPKRFTKSLSPSSLHRNTAKESQQQQYFELALPLPSDHLPPSCTHPILRHSFANTINGPPFTTPYSPPSDSWTSVAVEFRARCRGEQYDRISAVWLGGVEILRTSTAEPTEPGIFWKLRKDVTRYSSILSRSDLNFTVMLENVVDSEFTGIYHVEIDLLFYNQTIIALASAKPADLIVPISDSGERGFWFRSESESDVKSNEVSFPNNTRQAILELCVSFHGNDEFWYSNPPNSYVEINDLKTGRANGAYREIFATVDGELAVAEFPFPVIFTGGINPLFWEPIVAIGAFNLPTYDIELTPFLGKLLDGKSHRIGIGVSDGISYWLVNANLHLWLDPISPSVQTSTNPILNPALAVERVSQFKGLDGVFKIKAERTVRSTGWVTWSSGNHTTSFSQHYKLKNTITYSNGGSHKTVDQKVSVMKEVSVSDETGKVVRRQIQRKSFPLRVVMARMEGKVEGEYVALTNVSHSVNGRSFVAGDGIGKRRFSNEQVSGGWMEVKGHSVVSGGGETRQSLLYANPAGCFRQSFSTRNGQILGNDTSSQCLSLLPLLPLLTG